jgi:hypothetical protein
MFWLRAVQNVFVSVSNLKFWRRIRSGFARRQRRTNLDKRATGGGTARRPFQRHIQIRHVNDDKAAEKFFCLGLRSVMDVAFAMAHRNHRGRLRRLQSGAGSKDACRPDGVYVIRPSVHEAWLFATVEVFL